MGFASVQVGGPFRVRAGVAQGSPLSPLLYVIAAQPLAAALRGLVAAGRILALPELQDRPPFRVAGRPTPGGGSRSHNPAMRALVGDTAREAAPDISTKSEAPSRPARGGSEQATDPSGRDI